MIRSFQRVAFKGMTIKVTSRSMVSVKPHSDGSFISELVLERHEGKNAFSSDMIDSFEKAVESIRNNKNVRVLIVRSTVDKVFCAGADLKERLAMPEEKVAPFVGRLRNAFDSLATLPIPTIATIDGVALGGGLELALACDIRVASANATLGLPETNLAIIPGAGGTQRLPRVVGVAKAKQLIFTGARLNGIEAHGLGIVNEVVREGSSYAKAVEIANQIVDKGPVGVRMAKKAIDEGIAVPLSQALEIEKNCYAQVVPTKDRVEGLKSFTEKRKPVYRGE
jgi:methylglutaconyl-CoA hydratase